MKSAPLPIAANTRESVDFAARSAFGVFSIAVMLSAFLLFLIQPLIGKFIVPRFGGSASVWSTCMLFFQCDLLIGYAYAYVISRWLSRRAQVIVHSFVIILTCVSLRVVPPSISFDPNANPIWQILWLLTLSVGVPYAVLSASSPLLQSWFDSLETGLSPYRLFAVSNIGSLFALFAYPFLIEPCWSRLEQAAIWGSSFIVYAIMAVTLAILATRRVVARNVPRGQVAISHIPVQAWLIWVLLSACASSLLLGFTNVLCQEIAPVPLLWTLPLGLYLLTFVICFADQRCYNRRFFLTLLPTFVIPICYFCVFEQSLGGNVEIVLYLGCFFTSCMICHGELAALKPASDQLTFFYLIVACGGAGGGLFVAVLSPILFSAFVEFPLALFACAALAALTARRQQSRVSLVLTAPAMFSAVVAALMLAYGLGHSDKGILIGRSRSFYGVLSLYESRLLADDPQTTIHAQYNGGTLHGSAFVDPRYQLLPRDYYAPQSGVGESILALRRGNPMNIGIIGLGIGSLGGYGRRGDTVTFFEIAPDVLAHAMSDFAFLKSSPATVIVRMGDGRLSLESLPPQKFDILVVDAFSGDSIPVHLLTSQAFDLYRKHVNDDGAILVHTSSRHILLSPVVVRQAERLGWESPVFVVPRGQGVMPSEWVIVTKSALLLNNPRILAHCYRVGLPESKFPLWTDDYSDVISLLVAGR